jgi:hypothetical protein
MKDPRNPFRMRASEQIASEATFLRLFGPGALDFVPQDALDRRPWVIRSAPGGGKTSLLRVFTPSCLVTLNASKSNDEFKELYSRMRDLGAIDESGPRVLAVIVSCMKNYAPLEDFARDEMQAERLFFAMLNSRIVLAFIQGALTMRTLDYPSSISRISVNLGTDTARKLNLPEECSGTTVYEWARMIETSIATALDSLDFEPPTIAGFDGLLVLEGLSPEGIKIDGTPVSQKLLVMFDDVHKLAPNQRKRLGQTLTGDRNGLPAWIAERLEALSIDELLENGSRPERDFDEPAPTLENYWRKHNARFEKTVLNIADKRVREARAVEIDSFIGCVDSNLEIPQYQAQLEHALSTVSDRVRAKFGQDPRFLEWVPTIQRADAELAQQLVQWRTLEILLSRPPKKQLSLGIPFPDQDVPKAEENASIRSAAELFLAVEFGLPYYYGFSRVASLASCNYEQFLALSGDLFEEASSAAIVGKNHQLSAERQDRILKKAAGIWWKEDLLRAIPMRTEVRAFIESLGRFAVWETRKGNAPYAPGVTGIGLTMAERDRLCDPEILKTRPDLHLLASIISLCLAYNIMDAQLDRSQNYERRMILYLNRLLCAHFELPLQYGGWRPKKPEELVKWIKDGFRVPNSEEDRLI